MAVMDQLTVKERVQLANRKLQFSNMLQRGEVGHDGRFGDWRNVESKTGFKLALVTVMSAGIMACAFFSLLVLGGIFQL